MSQIILIRPGATDYDQEARIQGNLDIPLNEQGDAEVARIIGELAGRQIDAVYAPPCEPACQTAKTIAKAFGAKYRKLDRMENVNHGLWQGMKIEEVRRKHPRVFKQWQEQPENVCPPEGETLDMARQRMEAAFAKLLKRHKEGTIAVVLPEPMASLVRQHLDQSELGDLWKAGSEHGQWNVFEIPQPVASSGQ
ncbi:MAG: histidine phosphatase family protein [Pirellulales bacterium]|nr:histidine phosphatase family protein [Pirellulales bacterium]